MHGWIVSAGRWKRACLALPFLIAAQASTGTVYYSKEEAFELAFGNGAVVEARPVFLTDDQIDAIQKAAQSKLDSKLFTFYAGKRGDKLLGYMAIDSHTVRTQLETLMVVLTPAGELERIHILAFHEPPEYQASERWLAQLTGRPLDDLRRVDGISGATLSSQATLGSVRKVLSIFQIALERGER
jgi:hypothetical protein